MAKDEGLSDHANITADESGVLIKWDRVNGVFNVFFDGPPLHLDQLQSLFQSVLDLSSTLINKAGMIVPSMNEDDQKRYADEMPMTQYVKQLEASAEEDNTDTTTDTTNRPPWLN